MTLNSSHALLNGGFLASHCSQQFAGHSLVVCYGKASWGCFSLPGNKGSTIITFNSLAA